VTDFPEPVVPATSRCGILARLPNIALPDSPRPKATVSGLSDFWNLSSANNVASPTVAFSLFGTSIPTNDRPGIGASILIVLADKAKASSFCSPTILESLTPWAGLRE